MVGAKGFRWFLSRRIWALLVLFPGAAGCFPSPKPKAASTLKCPETQLVVQPNTTYSDVVSGCGKSDVIVMEGGGRMSSLRERVIFELSCPDEQIAVTVLSSSLYGVTGCGKKVMYKYVPGVGIIADTTQGEAPTGLPAAGAP
jgi:hypothetical protein